MGPDREFRQSKLALLSVAILASTLAIASASVCLAANYLQPGVTPPPGAPPPPGSGPNPPPLIQGDADAPQQPPSGTADPTTGSAFGTQPEMAPVPNRTDRAYPYPSGIAPAPRQRRLQYNPQTREYVYQNGVAQSNTVPRNMIVNDNPPAFGGMNDPAEAWLTYEQENFPLPSVKPFCRILVILGVVFATFYMITAAYGMIMGHKDSGNRVIGCAAGLILLLMAYCIYKVVMINALHLAVAGEEDVIRRRTPPNRVPLQPNNTPGVPAGAPGVARSNIQVHPFFNARVPR